MSSTTEPSLMAITIEGPADLIDRIAALKVDGLEISQPVFAQSPADILDAPMGGRKVLAILKIVTTLFTTATAGVKLAEEVEHFLHENPDAQVTIRDAMHGGVLTKSDGGSFPDDLGKVLQRDFGNHP
jgi:hypothetical protein